MRAVIASCSVGTKQRQHVSDVAVNRPRTMRKFRCPLRLFLKAVFFLVLMGNFSSQTLGLFDRSDEMRHASFSNVHDKVCNKSEALLSRRTVLDPIDCSFLCLMEPNCWAINYGLVTEKAAEFLCELFSWSELSESHLVKKVGFTHAQIATPCDSKPCENGGVCQPTNEPPHYKCACSSQHAGVRCQIDCVVFSFENGISDWDKTGTAFDTQPTYGDNPTARGKGQPANQVGDWWIGTYENRPTPSATAGQIQGDGPTGTLTSPEFQIRGKTLSFLVGGGCDINVAYAELLVDGVSVSRETGLCNEAMKARQWDVSAHTSKKARLRLVDAESQDWQHINFDHLVDGFCEENSKKGR